MKSLSFLSVLLAGCTAQHVDSQSNKFTQAVYESQDKIIYRVNGEVKGQVRGREEKYSLGREVSCSDEVYRCVEMATMRLVVPINFKEGKFQYREIAYDMSCVGLNIVDRCDTYIVKFSHRPEEGLPRQQGLYSFEPQHGIRLLVLVNSDPLKPEDSSLSEVFTLRSGEGFLSK